jgi:hypothetical protein
MKVGGVPPRSLTLRKLESDYRRDQRGGSGFSWGKALISLQFSEIYAIFNLDFIYEKVSCAWPGK